MMEFFGANKYIRTDSSRGSQRQLCTVLHTLEENYIKGCAKHFQELSSSINLLSFTQSLIESVTGVTFFMLIRLKRFEYGFFDFSQFLPQMSSSYIDLVGVLSYMVSLYVYFVLSIVNFAFLTSLSLFQYCVSKKQ